MVDGQCGGITARALKGPPRWPRLGEIVLFYETKEGDYALAKPAMIMDSVWVTTGHDESYLNAHLMVFDRYKQQVYWVHEVRQGAYRNNCWEFQDLTNGFSFTNLDKRGCPLS